MEKLSGAATPKSEQTGEGSSVPSSSSTPAPAAPEKVESAPKPKLNITKALSPAAATTPENPFTKLTARSSNGTPTPTVRTSSEPKSLKRPRAESDEQNPRAPARKLATPSNDEDIDEYANRILGQIFRITLDPAQKVDASNHRLIYLPNLRQELEEENAPIRLSKDRLDSALLEAASTVPNNKSILDYLLPAWKRITKALKGLRGYVNGKDAVLKEAKRLCMSNCIFAVEMPELYGSV
jgi:ubiquitin conjugation factor E4 B